MLYFNGNIEIEKHKFYRNKSLMFLEDVDINNVFVSSKISSGAKKCKYFIGFFCDDYKSHYI